MVWHTHLGNELHIKKKSKRFVLHCEFVNVLDNHKA